MFINTLSCKNLISINQAARNKSILNFRLSSETKREISFKFTLFSEQYSKLIGKEAPDFNWLVWFIGFSEGDGAILTYEGRLRFVLTQKESSILRYIQ